MTPVHNVQIVEQVLRIMHTVIITVQLKPLLHIIQVSDLIRNYRESLLILLQNHLFCEFNKGLLTEDKLIVQLNLLPVRLAQNNQIS